MPFIALAEIPFPGWNPVALQLGPVAVRWYGLGYLVGFILAGWIFDRLSKAGFLKLDRDSVSDLIGWLVGGGLAGGRLGYAVIYEQGLLANPLLLVQIWRGGLSFHGGLAGMLIASAIFARRRGVSWRRVLDSMALAAPFGIFLVRCANFVNAELFGRLAPGLPWGVRFPTDPVARSLSPELARTGTLHWHEPYARLKESGAWSAIEAQIPLRHPSQLYEACLEGAVIAAVLWWLYSRRAASRRPGAYAAAFLALYAVGRFVAEFSREPDAQLGLVLGPLSMGQLLSFLVAGFAAVLFWWPTRSADTLSAQSPS